jgi:hypothetical protein
LFVSDAEEAELLEYLAAPDTQVGSTGLGHLGHLAARCCERLRFG